MDSLFSHELYTVLNNGRLAVHYFEIMDADFKIMDADVKIMDADTEIMDACRINGQQFSVYV